jgi:cysteine desulfurase/selenocysteine lyase
MKARAAASNLIGGQANELAFTRGATEAIIWLRAACPRWTQPRSAVGAEHHSNIVPWQLAGYEIDVCPITEDGRIDLDAAEQLISDGHRVSRSRMCPTCSARSSTQTRRADRHSKGALLLDGCQAVPRRRSTSPRSAAISMHIPATRFTARPVSVACGADTTCCSKCRHGRAEDR